MRRSISWSKYFFHSNFQQITDGLTRSIHLLRVEFIVQVYQTSINILIMGHISCLLGTFHSTIMSLQRLKHKANSYHLHQLMPYFTLEVLRKKRIFSHFNPSQGCHSTTLFSSPTTSNLVNRQHQSTPSQTIENHRCIRNHSIQPSKAKEWCHNSSLINWLQKEHPSCLTYLRIQIYINKQPNLCKLLTYKELTTLAYSLFSKMPSQHLRTSRMKSKSFIATSIIWGREWTYQ